MRMTLTRRWFTARSTIGSMRVSPLVTVYTLEDPVRTGPKVPGSTAIPAGLYQVVITKSPRFGEPMPLLLSVPGFEGIRIHPGNVPDDTEGCILPGRARSEDRVYNSREAYQVVFREIDLALRRRERVDIDIREERPR